MSWVSHIRNQFHQNRLLILHGEDAKAYMESAFEPEATSALNEICNQSEEYKQADRFMQGVIANLEHMGIESPLQWLSTVHMEAGDDAPYVSLEKFNTALDKAFSEKHCVLDISESERERIYDYIRLKNTAYASYVGHVHTVLDSETRVSERLEPSLVQAFDVYFAHGARGGVGNARAFHRHLEEMDICNAATRWYDNLVGDWMQKHQHSLDRFYDQEKLEPALRDISNCFVERVVREHFVPDHLLPESDDRFLSGSAMLMDRIGQKGCSRLTDALSTLLDREDKLNRAAASKAPSRSL